MKVNFILLVSEFEVNGRPSNPKTVAAAGLRRAGSRVGESEDDAACG